MDSLIATFRDLPDPRHHRTRHHDLLSVLVIALLAVMCGANTWVEVAVFGRSREEWLRRYLPLEHGTPSHDTFGRVFASLEPTGLQERFLSWMSSLLDRLAGQQIAIDGKAVRGSHTGEKKTSAIHLVNAWLCGKDLVFGQFKVDGKSNEITAIPELLAALDIRDCLISIDAMGCQVAIAQQVRQQHGHYLLAVKDNQPTLHQALRDAFEQLDPDEESPMPDASIRPPLAHDYDQSQDAAHNRDEVRRVWSMSVAAALAVWSEDQKEEIARWPGLTTLVCVESERQVLDRPKSIFHRYFIASSTLTAAEAGQGVRTHWEVENCLHWRLDVIYREDASRIRTGHAPENMSLLRKMSLNAIRANHAKGSVQAKRFRAALEPDFLLDLLKAVTNPTPPPPRKPRKSSPSHSPGV